MMQVVTSGSTRDNGIGMSSEVRFLPSFAVSKLALILESIPGWREVMGQVPSDPWKPGEPIPDGFHYPRKYTSDDINLISQECMHYRRKGFEVLLEEWGTSGRQRPTVQDLVFLLQKAKLYRALDYLTVTVLHGKALPRVEGNPLNELEKALEDQRTRCHRNVVFGTYAVDVKGSAPSSHAEAFNVDNVVSSVNDITHQTTDVLGNRLEEDSTSSPSFDPEILQGMDCSDVFHFSYSGLQGITNNFSNVEVNSGGNKLGEGAFGVVYFGKVFHEGRDKKVAIKRLNAGESRVELQFKTEIEVLSRYNHENLIPLEGYSCDGPAWCLVYAYMPNGSLQDCLACSNGREPLDWRTRLCIGEGSVRGIVYLHTYQETPLVHRDIKSANILLDENLIPKVGDFGLARLGGSGTHTRTLIKTTTVFGTSAYMAPEAFRGDISVKMDTFSFGVVLLELLTGLPSYDEDRGEGDLLTFVQEHEGELKELVDTNAGNWNVDVAMDFFSLAELCTDYRKFTRPTMVQVLEKYSTILCSSS